MIEPWQRVVTVGPAVRTEPWQRVADSVSVNRPVALTRFSAARGEPWQRTRVLSLPNAEAYQRLVIRPG